MYIKSPADLAELEKLKRIIADIIRDKRFCIAASNFNKDNYFFYRDGRVVMHLWFTYMPIMSMPGKLEIKTILGTYHKKEKNEKEAFISFDGYELRDVILADHGFNAAQIQEIKNNIYQKALNKYKGFSK